MSSQIFVLAFIFLPLLISCVSIFKNVNNLQQLIATDKIQAEFYTLGSYFQTYNDCTQDPTITYLGELSPATVLEYDHVDFGSGVKRVSLRVVNTDPNAAVTISLHLSHSFILAIPINYTGSDKCAFVTVDVALQVILTGNQNLYITIPSGQGNQLFLDWFQFSETSVEIIPATERIQAEDYDYAQQVWVSDNCSDVTIYISGFGLVQYNQVDFGDGVQSVTVRLFSTSHDAQSISFTIGNTSNSPFANIKLGPTGESCNFVEVSADVTVLSTGVQTLFISSNYENFGYLDSFVFVRKEGKWNATERIEAEDYTSASNVSVYADCSDPSISYVGGLVPASRLEYDLVNFGSGVEAVTLRVYSVYTGPPLKVALHLTSYTATPFITVQVGQTGSGRCDFYTTTVFLTTIPTGVQKLYITFPSNEGGYLHLDWFSFSKTVNSN